MKTLAPSFTQKGFHHQQIERDGNLAIFKRWKNPENPHFEVVKIQESKARVIGGREIEAAEYYPGPGQWGKLGWSYSGENALDLAMARFRDCQTRRNAAEESDGAKRRNGSLGVLAAFCAIWLCACATTQPSVKGLTKDEIKLEQAKLVDKREIRNERWARIGEAAGTMAINIAGSWVKAWFGQPDDDGFKK